MSDVKYELKRFESTLTTKDFYNRFSNFDLVQGYCKQCPRYNTNFACSPVDIDIKEFILDFDYIDIIVTQLRFNPEDYTKEYSKDDLSKLLKETFLIEKLKVSKEVLDKEKEYPKAHALTGPCTICDVKCRQEYDKCIHPDKMRYSLASLGMDSSKILKELFDIELLLIEGKLPRYLNNVSSILYKKS